MGEASPQLVFLSGPQQGQRVVLAGRRMVAGRNSQADIPLTEEFVSRRHMQFVLTGEGWLVENLSPNGTKINDRRYKSGQLVLLATGDVLEAGKQTQLLFVAGGDDPQKAEAAYRQAHPAPPQPPPPPPQEAEAEPKPAPPPPGAAAWAEDGPPTVALQAQQRKKKLRRYAIAFVVYMVLFILVIVLLQSRRKEQQVQQAPLVQLTRAQIEEILGEPQARPVTKDRAEAALLEAMDTYKERTAWPGARYKCVKAFKEYLAYKKTLEDREHFQALADKHAGASVSIDQMHKAVLAELIEQVAGGYESAVRLEGLQQWVPANMEWQKLFRMLPEPDPGSLVRTRLMENIEAHWQRVKANLPHRR